MAEPATDEPRRRGRGGEGVSEIRKKMEAASYALKKDRDELLQAVDSALSAADTRIEADAKRIAALEAELEQRPTEDDVKEASRS